MMRFGNINLDCVSLEKKNQTITLSYTVLIDVRTTDMRQELVTEQFQYIYMNSKWTFQNQLCQLWAVLVNIYHVQTLLLNYLAEHGCLLALPVYNELFLSGIVHMSLWLNFEIIDQRRRKIEFQRGKKNKKNNFFK